MGPYSAIVSKDRDTERNVEEVGYTFNFIIWMKSGATIRFGSANQLWVEEGFFQPGLFPSNFYTDKEGIVQNMIDTELLLRKWFGLPKES